MLSQQEGSTVDLGLNGKKAIVTGATRGIGGNPSSRTVAIVMSLWLAMMSRICDLIAASMETSDPSHWNLISVHDNRTASERQYASPPACTTLVSAIAISPVGIPANGLVEYQHGHCSRR
jgi:hypothetical protein